MHEGERIVPLLGKTVFVPFAGCACQSSRLQIQLILLLAGLTVSAIHVKRLAINSKCIWSVLPIAVWPHVQ